RVIARTPEPVPEDAIASAMRRIEGAYTIVVLVAGRVLGFRDAHAIRPLAIGTTGRSWILASETCAFDHLGALPVRDVDPGELVILDATGLRSIQVLAPGRVAHCVFEYIYFARPDTVLAGRTVHLARRRMGRILAREHPAQADVVISVRDSGVSAAMGFAEASSIPLEVGLVKNRYIGRTFIQPDPATRDFGVRVKLNPLRDVLDGRRVVLVDDSIVRGTTSGKIVRMLRAAGATEVHARISSPPIRYPCFYGIDTSSRGQLVASTHSVETIRELIAADSLGYLSQAGLVRHCSWRLNGCAWPAWMGTIRLEFRWNPWPGGMHWNRWRTGRWNLRCAVVAAMSDGSLTYRASGVDRAAVAAALDAVHERIRGTFTTQVLGDVGHFAGLFRLGGFRDPVLVSSIDGVGTKVLLARQAGRMEAVGRDAIMHGVNDVAVMGAAPLFALD